MSNREVSAYDEMRMGVELDAILEDTTPEEIIRRRAERMGNHVVSTGENEVGPIRRKLGNALIWIVEKGQKHG